MLNDKALEEMRKKAAEKASVRQSYESAMNQHSLMQKKVAAAQAGKDFSKVKLEGVDPSKAEAVSSGASKFAAAAQLAQAAGGIQADNALGGAMSGAASGVAFGPAGAVVGGVAGAVMGAAAAREARKAHNAKIEMQKQQALGNIALEEGRQQAQNLGSMGARIGASLRIPY